MFAATQENTQIVTTPGNMSDKVYILPFFVLHSGGGSGFQFRTKTHGKIFKGKCSGVS